MSPEQVVGEFDHRSDVYSLGLTLYEQLTFRPAHDASIRSRIVQQISEASPRSPRLINPAIPGDLETFILKATAHSPDDRYQTAKELAEDLQRFVGGFPIHARRFSAAEQLWRWSRRNPALAWTTATTLVLLMTVGREDFGPPREGRDSDQKGDRDGGGFGPPGRGPGPEHHGEHGPPKELEELMVATRRESRRLLETLIDEVGDHPDYQMELAKSLLTSASSRRSNREFSDPFADLNSAIAILERLAAKYPGNPDYQFQLADALALASPEIQRFESPVEVAARCSRSIEIARKLQSQFPNAPEYDILLANSLRRLSGLQNDQEQLKASQASVDEAVSILRRLTKVWPGHAIYRLSLARALLHSAMLERRLKSSDLSLQRLDEAVALFGKIELSGEKPTFETAMLSMIHRSRAELLKRDGRASEAEKVLKLANDLAPWLSNGPGGGGGPKPPGWSFGRPGGVERYPQRQQPNGAPPGRPENYRPEKDPVASDSTERDRPQRDRLPAQ